MYCVCLFAGSLSVRDERRAAQRRTTHTHGPVGTQGTRADTHETNVPALERTLTDWRAMPLEAGKPDAVDGVGILASHRRRRRSCGCRCRLPGPEERFFLRREIELGACASARKTHTESESRRGGWVCERDRQRRRETAESYCAHTIAYAL